MILLLTILFCGCNEVTEATKESTKGTTASTAATTSGTVATTQTGSVQNGESNKKPEIVRKKVALTFDDGPDDQNTVMLVDELKRYGFNATFFVIGKKIVETDYGSDVLKYVVENGNEIGVHAYTHTINYSEVCSDEKYAEEIRKTEEAIHTVLPNYEIKLMRPVEGLMTDERAAASKYPVMHWNIDTFDWKYTARDSALTMLDNIKIIKDTVITRIKEGDIVLMHEIHDNSYEAAVIILEWLYDNGYEVVTVSELLGENAQPGVRYYKAP